MIIKVMTYNIQHGLDYLKRLEKNERKVDLEKIASVINDIKPDVIGLNEIYNSGEEELCMQTEKIADLIDYPYYYFGKAILINGKEFGNAVISKYPFKDIETISIPDPIKKCGDKYYESRCLIKFKLDVNTSPTFLVTHFGLNDDEALNAYTVITNNIENNTIFMGDLNLTPDSKIISLIQNHLKDTVLEKQGVKFTFPSVNANCKIDYIFSSKENTVIEADVYKKTVSDHYPCYALINIKE